MRVVLNELDVVLHSLERDLPVVLAGSGLWTAVKEVLHFLKTNFRTEPVEISHRIIKISQRTELKIKKEVIIIKSLLDEVDVYLQMYQRNFTKRNLTIEITIQVFRI